MKKLNLRELNACPSAIKWFDNQESNEQAWANCHRGDWMLWIAARLNVDIRTLILAKAYCAKTVYYLLTDDRSREAIVAAINFGRGLISEKELKEAADAAYIAATNATYAVNAAAYAVVYAADAAYAAVYAADAAYAAVYATKATYVAYTAAYAATRTADAAASYVTETTYAAETIYTANTAYKNNQQKTADICRKYLTKVVFDKISKL